MPSHAASNSLAIWRWEAYARSGPRTTVGARIPGRASGRLEGRPSVLRFRTVQPNGKSPVQAKRVVAQLIPCDPMVWGRSIGRGCAMSPGWRNPFERIRTHSTSPHGLHHRSATTPEAMRGVYWEEEKARLGGKSYRGQDRTPRCSALVLLGSDDDHVTSAEHAPLHQERPLIVIQIGGDSLGTCFEGGRYSVLRLG